MRKCGVLLLAVALSLTGCVPSLNPLYTEKDLVFEPVLIGVWAESDDDKETWAFEKSGDKQYKLTYTVDGKAGVFQAHLLKLGDTLFLDLYPDDAGLKDIAQNDFYKSHLIPSHTFAKVSQIEPKLQMAFLNPKWLQELLDKNPGAIAHQKVDGDRLVLTASTSDLQKFVLKHVGTKGAFGDEEPVRLKRIQPKQK